MNRTTEEISAAALVDAAMTAATARRTLARPTRRGSNVRAIARGALESSIAHFATIAEPWAREQEAIAREALAIFDRETTP